jgi:hypothetical protein
MAYGKNEGRFRETRASRFGANMGGEAAPVKSTDVEMATEEAGTLSEKL